MALERVLEPEVMDSDDEAIDYDSMDHSEVNRAFVADLLAVEGAGREVIDLGTGTALIPIELCQQNSHCRVTAVYLTDAMLRLARDRIRAAGLE